MSNGDWQNYFKLSEDKPDYFYKKKKKQDPSRILQRLIVYA